ncbi:DMT family transporter [Kordiimonas sp. SCSIO 12610]|uniref:DMT family transporter n=1 Tax=Kordiimonas sp. SCSIO 12610 TaxID=2829597 RepID=UPI00210E2155|nr:DMT family transporter [Kordiimonas sp. SCSIO 12610]UTW56090.1 DMT family transporter [Kordiimonas sp. SCSIO 12610]
MSFQNWVLLFFLSTLWGVSFVFIEMALPVFEPFTIVFLRASIGGLILLAFMKMRGASFPRGIKVWFDYAVMAALIVVIPYSLITWAQTYVTASMASILNAMTPIFTVIVAHFTTKDERLTGLKVFGTIAGFIGVTLLMLPNLEGGFRIEGLSPLAVILATIAYAFANVWGKRLSAYKAEVNSTAILLISGGMLLIPGVVAGAGTSFNDIGIAPIFAILGIGVLSTGLAYIIYFKILAEAGATNIVLVTFLIPVSAVMLGVIYLGEKLYAHHFYAVLCIFIGLIAIDGRLLRRLRVARS